MNASVKTKLNILSLKEDPAHFEKIIHDQQIQAEQNADIKSLLDSIFLEKNRDLAFKRFFHSREFKTIQKILSIFSVNTNHRIAEIGGGPGFLSWALSQSGYQNIELIEPNPYFNTGTGYIRTREDTQHIVFHNHLNQWHDTASPYDVVITKNCIHHFQNIAQSAAAIRQKMREGALWFSFREWFADTPEELYTQLSNHPYCQPYNIYEWPYPASHYAEAIEIAGFELVAVIPYDYANNCLGTWSEGDFSIKISKLTNDIDQLLKKNPKQTVQDFWSEVSQQQSIRSGIKAQKNNLIKTLYKRIFQTKEITHLKFYTRPQMMLFKKIKVDAAHDF